MVKSIETEFRSFKTQKSALDYYKQILHSYQNCQRICYLGDHADLVALSKQYDPILDEDGSNSVLGRRRLVRRGRSTTIHSS